MNPLITISLILMGFIGTLLVLGAAKHGWRTELSEQQARLYITAMVVAFAIGMIGAVT